MNLSNRRILVTGASSGIGEVAARQLVAAGAEVVLVSEQAEALQRVAEALNATGGKATPLVADFAHPEQVTGLWARAEALVGPIDTLINNAGIGMGASVLETRDQDLRLLFEINFFALATLSREALVAMSRRQRGWIINVTSASARLGWRNISAYSATKGAVHAFTQALRVEAAPYRVRVSEVLPISVRTPFFQNVQGAPYQPAGWVLTPEEVAGSILACAATVTPSAEVLPFPWIRLVFVLETLFPTWVARFATRYHKSKPL